ncbi:MAG: hypothetical protein AB7I49_02720 [Candidatus Nitrosocosmicus sp.]
MHQKKRPNDTFDTLPTSPRITNQTMDINKIRNQAMSIDIIPRFDNDIAVDLKLE